MSNEESKTSEKKSVLKVKVKGASKSLASRTIDKDTFREMVDVVLESNGVPRRYLYEYPYNEFESARLIKHAEKTVEDLAEILKIRIDRS